MRACPSILRSHRCEPVSLSIDCTRSALAIVALTTRTRVVSLPRPRIPGGSSPADTANHPRAPFSAKIVDLELQRRPSSAPSSGSRAASRARSPARCRYRVRLSRALPVADQHHVRADPHPGIQGRRHPSAGGARIASRSAPLPPASAASRSPAIVESRSSHQRRRHGDFICDHRGEPDRGSRRASRAENVSLVAVC